MFLHDLHFGDANPLPEVIEKDTLLVLTHVKAKAKAPGRTLSTNTSPSEQYPFGETPSWSTIKNAVENEPQKIMRPFVFSGIWSSYHSAARLFVDFTTQIWLACSDEYLSSNAAVRPTALEGAMHYWTISSVYESLTRTVFICLGAELPNAPSVASDHRSFKQRRSTFFPNQATEFRATSPWTALAQSPGYIFDYWTTLNQIGIDDGSEAMLNAQLDELFSALHCLPEIRAETEKRNGSIWTTELGNVFVVTNPRYYRIAGIGKERQQDTSRAPPATRTQQDLKQALLDLYGVETTDRAVVGSKNKEQQALRKRRSGKANNKRKPPVKASKRGTTVNVIAEGQNDGKNGDIESSDNADQLVEDDNEEADTYQTSSSQQASGSSRRILRTRR